MPSIISPSLQPVSIGAKSLSSDDIKIIGGTGYDLRQPIPIKYQEVRQRFLDSRQNFWTPNEISMADDKMQWNSPNALLEEERFLFKCNISYLTASDNLVPDNMIEAVYPHITNNEMRQYLRLQIHEESNHLESYLFILESFGLDEKGQGQIFELYQEIPELARKLNWNIEFSNRLATCEYPIGSPEVNRLLLEDLISYYVFEFMFFPPGFAQIFAMARQGKLRNTSEQYQFIWKDEAGHSENGCWLINQIKKENPELWDSKMIDRARGIINEGVIVEKAYAQATMPGGGIPGMSAKSYLQYSMFMADIMCRSIGLKPLFNIKEHPMPWLAEFELNKETNFFEGRVKDYRVGSNLDWD